MVKGRETKFCSKKCKLNNRMKKDSIFYEEKPCECCGTIFKSKIKENKKFCSYKCSGQNKKNVSREIKTCLLCGTKFNERIKRVKNFCSDKCIKEWQAKPENISLRIKKLNDAVFKKYGVENIFQVNSIRLKAQEKAKESLQASGYITGKNNLIAIENRRKNKLIKRFSEKGYTILEFKDENIVVQHPDGHIFENNRKLIVNRLNHEVELSTEIQPIGSPRTTFERKICKMLDDNNIIYSPNNRKIINGELDIYIPSYNLAIEINGLHWHSEYYINNDYHLIKTNKCNNLNIQLLHFFEDELIEKYNIVESIIKEKLNLNTTILVNDCIIKEIDSDTSKKFLEYNYIKGYIGYSIKLGLFYNDELVSVMLFNNLKNKVNEYNVLFCNKININIINGCNNLYNYLVL